jgi:hypothetical protein
VQVPYVEGVAIHIGPEPCADAREGRLRSVGRGVRRPAIERVLQQHRKGEFEMNA